MKLNYSIRIKDRTYSGKETVSRREHKGGNHLGTDNVLFHDLGGSNIGFHFMVIYLAIHLVFLHFAFDTYCYISQ